MMAPFITPGQRGACPGVTEYGHGLTARVVHGDTCCERWDSASTEERQAIAQSRGIPRPDLYARDREISEPEAGA